MATMVWADVTSVGTHCLVQDNMEEVGDCGGLVGNLMFLPSTSMQDKLASILEIPRSRDDPS